MSEQSSAVWFDERIEEAKRKEKGGIIISMLGITLAVFSFLYPIMMRLVYVSIAFLIFFFAAVLFGLFSVILGFLFSLRYEVDCGVLTRQKRNAIDCQYAP